MRWNDEDLLRKWVAAANVGETCKDGIHDILVEVTSHSALDRSGCRADPESTSMALAFILILSKSSKFDLCCNIPQEFREIEQKNDPFSRAVVRKKIGGHLEVTTLQAILERRNFEPDP
jgi:hypothetical protein